MCCNSFVSLSFFVWLYVVGLREFGTKVVLSHSVKFNVNQIGLFVLFADASCVGFVYYSRSHS